MTQRNQPCLFTLACVIAAALGTFVSSARAERAPLSSEQFAALLRQLVQESVPIVEYIAQRKFKTSPKVVVGDVPAATRSLANDFFVQLKAKAPEIDGSTLRAYAEHMALEMLPSIVGKYGMQDQTLYLFPEHLHENVDARDIDPASLPEMIRLVLIHELSHALHDQHLSLSTQLLAAMTNASQHTAYSTVLEGFATYVEERSAALLGISEETQRALLIKRVDARMLSDEGYRVNLQAEQYLTGAKFFHEIYRREGDAGVWRHLTNPPKDSDYITRIAESKDGKESIERRDLTPALSQLNAAFTGRGYVSVLKDLRGVQLAAYLGPRFKDPRQWLFGGAEIRAHLKRNEEDRFILFLLLRGLNSTVAADMEKGALDQFLANMRSLDKEGISKTHRSFNHQNSKVNLITYPHKHGNRVMQIATIFVRHGLTCALAVTRDSLFSEAEMLALTHSAAVSIEALFQKPLPSDASPPAPAAVAALKGTMPLKELKTMLSMRFSEREILDALAKRPLGERLDAQAQQELASAGATPAILAKAAAPQPAATTEKSEIKAPPEPMAQPRIPAPAIPKLIKFEITERDLEALKKR